MRPTAGNELGHFRVVLKLGPRAALKVLPPGFECDLERLHRLQLEARLAAGLNHPNIVTLYEIGAWEGRPFIAAEFV